MLVVGRSPSGRLEGDINLSFLADVKSQICSRLGDTLPSVLCIEYNKGKERERALLRTFPAFSSPSSIMPPFPSPLRTLPHLGLFPHLRLDRFLPYSDEQPMSWRVEPVSFPSDRSFKVS
jgi:hypothetical protein